MLNADAANPPSWLRLWLPRFVLACLALYLASAILPFTPVEGDEQGVLNGVIAAEQHRSDFRELAYIYSIQPGSFQLIRVVHLLMQGRPIVAFGILTALGAAGFVILMTLVGARLCGCRPVWVGFFLCATQELVSAAWYANTCAMAAAFVAGALLLGTRKRSTSVYILAALCIALGAWIRMDVLLITPAFWPIVYWVDRDLLKSIKITSLVAATSAILLSFFLYISGTSPLESWSTYIDQPAGPGWRLLFHLGWLAASATMTMAIFVSAFALWFRRERTLLCCALAALLPTILVYGRELTTTKYLYYALPFAVFLVIRWLVLLSEDPRSRPRALVCPIVAILLLEGILGIRTSEPAYRRFMTGAWTRIVTLPPGLTQRPVRIGFGEGEIVGTDDGFRVRTGWAYAPRVWRREKLAILPELALVEQAIKTPNSTIITSTYLSNRVATGALLRSQSVCSVRKTIPEDVDSFYNEWERPGSRIVLVLVNNSPKERILFQRYSESLGPVFFINDRGRNAAHYLGVDSSGWTCLSPKEESLLTTYTKKRRE